MMVMMISSQNTTDKYGNIHLLSLIATYEIACDNEELQAKRYPSNDNKIEPLLWPSFSSISISMADNDECEQLTKLGRWSELDCP